MQSLVGVVCIVKTAHYGGISPLHTAGTTGHPNTSKVGFECSWYTCSYLLTSNTLLQVAAHWATRCTLLLPLATAYMTPHNRVQQEQHWWGAALGKGEGKGRGWGVREKGVATSTQRHQRTVTASLNLQHTVQDSSHIRRVRSFIGTPTSYIGNSGASVTIVQAP